jgi:hypothetical protein
MSTLTALRPLVVTTNASHVRIAHKNYSAKNPELVGQLVESGSEVSFRLYMPALNEILTYRAPILGDAA